MKLTPIPLSFALTGLLLVFPACAQEKPYLKGGATLGGEKAVVSLDAASIKEFGRTFKGQNTTVKTGDDLFPWSMNTWNADTTAQIALENGALVFRNLEGPASIQFYNWQPFALPLGRRYLVRLEYAGQNGAGGVLRVEGEGVTTKEIALTATNGTFKTVEEFLALDGAAQATFKLQNFAAGRDNAILIKSLQILDMGATGADATQAKTPEAAGAANITGVTYNATSDLTPLAAAKVGNNYNRALVQEVAALKPRALILPTDPDAALSLFQFNSVEGPAQSEIVDSSGPVVGGMAAFKKAYRVQTSKKPVEWMTHLQMFPKVSNVRRGDVLYVTAYTRLLARTDGQAVGAGRLYASSERGDKDSSPLGQADFPISREWTRIHIPMEAQRDFQDGDTMKLMFTFGFTGQTIEFGGLQVINFGPGLDKARLPHPELNLDYPGRDLKAAWRTAAAQRIEKYRKGNLKIVVTDAAGKPVKDAQVGVNMTRHAFLFGSSFPSAMLPSEYQQIKPWNADFQRTAGASDADKKRIQQEFLRLFNCATGGAVWGTWGGNDARISQSDLLGAMRWFEERNIPMYNSQAVYPSPEFTAPEIEKTLMKPEKKAEFEAALRNWVHFSATKFYPAVKSLQIANEIEGRPQYTNILGRESVPNWFRWVKEANPEMETEINGPYSLGQSEVKTQNRGTKWPDQEEGLQYYFDLISWLHKKGAPIDAIGFQNHGALGMPSPEAVLKSLDQFATFGKPLAVTEYELTVQNGADAAQRQYQADYTRDFFTAIFSHPQTRAIILQDFWQPAAWQYEGASAFFNKDWSMNPNGKAYEDLVLKQWWTRATGKSSAQGSYATRGFLGDYEVTVTAGGKTKTVTTSLTKAGGNLKIVLE